MNGDPVGSDEDRLVQRLLAIGRDCAARLPEPYRSIDHGRLLYDSRGLPGADNFTRTDVGPAEQTEDERQ